MSHYENALSLRQSAEKHYNCAQSVLCAFEDKLPFSSSQLYAMGAHFGSGMYHGGTCGALTGALMTLGLLGAEKDSAQKLIQAFEAASGALSCQPLLARAKESGQEKKPFCDDLVYFCVQEIDKILQAND